jgi:WD40 repeat protein/serine/threonine protein kinase
MSVDPLRLKELFLATVQIPDLAQRETWLVEQCGQERDLLAKVQALLKARDNPESFLDFLAPPAAVPEEQVSQTSDSAPAATLDHPVSEAPATVIGPYKLLQQIGEGGMGTVYMAEQTEPVYRKVALKIIKAGMDSRQIIARFEAERQALALMDHPNIAKVFDAGTTRQEEGEKGRQGEGERQVLPISPSPCLPVSLSSGGRPYFVMELVKGLPITKYCDEHHLTPRQRLELFIPVCQAVQHAHQKGIIHRDLKPSNVLVALYDGKPVPKVIDFGVAKAAGPKLTDRTLYTEFGAVVGTFEYMSPEQAELNQLDVDTRSDIYSLGVLLYELLTGTTPLERKRVNEAALLEVLRLIREEDPPKPSTRLLDSKDSLPSISAQRQMEPAKLTKLLRGELDWLVMKCLEKDRNRRYETANGLVHDIERYLHDEPVQACPPSVIYRLRKFAWRNKVALATATVVVAALLVGSGVAIWQAVRATKAEGLAQERFETATANYEEAEVQRQIAKTQEALAKEQELLGRRRLYASQTNLAYEAWKKGQTARVLELLEGQRPQAGQEDLRSFDWYFLWNLGRRGARQVLRGHSGQVLSLAFAPDGKTLAAGDHYGTVTLWDVASRKERHSLPRQPDAMWSLAYSSDGRTLATAGYTGFVRLWDPRTGKEQGELPKSQGNWTSIAFSLDGTRLAAAEMDGRVRLWDMKTRGEPAILRGMPEPSYVNVSISPDGKRLAAANDWSETPRTLVWDLTIDPPRVAYQLPGAVSVAFSPDSQTLALAGNGKLSLVDAATGKEKSTHRADCGNIKALAFSPDGRSLAYGSDDQTVRLWNRVTGQERRYSHGAPVDCLAFSPDGTMVASGGKDETIKFWDVDWEPDAASLPYGDAVKVLAFSPDGRTLAAGGADTVRLWNLIDGRELATLKLSTGKVCAALAFSHDGHTLAVAGGGRNIKLFDTARWQEKATLEGHAGNVSNLTFSADGRTLAWCESGSTSYTSYMDVKVWDVSTGQVRFSVRRKTSGLYMAFSPDGKLLATSSGHVFVPASLTLLDVANGRERLTLSTGVPALPTGVAFSPDGSTVALALGWGQIFLWDVQTGKLRNCLRGHTGYIQFFAFHPDGKILASSNGDGSISLWDLVAGQERMVLTGHVNVANFVAFTPDGTMMVTAGGDGLVKLWYGPAGQDARAPKAEQDPLAVWAPTTGDLNQWTEQLELRLRKALEEPPDQAQETRLRLAQKYSELGQMFLNAQRYPQAVKAYSRAIELDAKDGFAWNARGVAHARQGQWEKAVAEFNKAIELDPTNGVIRHNRGASYAVLRQWDKAIVDFSKAIELEPKHTTFWFNRSYQRLGQFQDVRESLDKARKQMEQETHAPDTSWNRRLTLQLLRKEVETLLGTTRDEKTHDKDSKDAR